MAIWFPRREYESRFEKLRASLDRQKLDALFVTWDTNLRYYAGAREATAVGSLTRVTATLLPRSGQPVLFVHAFQADDARASVWFDDVRPYHQLLGAPVDDLVAEIRSRGLRRIGAELGMEQRLGLPFGDFIALREKLKGVEWVDAADIIWQQRMRKSLAELDCLRRAGQITARAYDAVFPRVEAGMTERDVARMLQGAMFEAGAEQVAFVLMTSGEGNYGRISGLATDRRLEKGDMLWIDMGARVNDYCADYSRAAVLGRPSDRQQRMQEIVIAATAKGVECAAPGVHVGEIVTACNEELKRRGLEITFDAGRVGHGVGLNVTEHPHVAKYDPTVLEPGMVITVEPGIVEPYGTFHVEENIIITEGGAEVISVAGRELRAV